jgi:hypothetical protein
VAISAQMHALAFGGGLARHATRTIRGIGSERPNVDGGHGVGGIVGGSLSSKSCRLGLYGRQPPELDLRALFLLEGGMRFRCLTSVRIACPNATRPARGDERAPCTTSIRRRAEQAGRSSPARPHQGTGRGGSRARPTRVARCMSTTAPTAARPERTAGRTCGTPQARRGGALLMAEQS